MRALVAGGRADAEAVAQAGAVALGAEVVLLGVMVLRPRAVGGLKSGTKSQLLVLKTCLREAGAASNLQRTHPPNQPTLTTPLYQSSTTQHKAHRKGEDAQELDLTVELRDAVLMSHGGARVCVCVLLLCGNVWCVLQKSVI